jgi:Tfp pilus assembly protein PilX
MSLGTILLVVLTLLLVGAAMNGCFASRRLSANRADYEFNEESI